MSSFAFPLDLCNRKEFWVLNSDNIAAGPFESTPDCLVESGSATLHNGRKSSVDL